MLNYVKPSLIIHLAIYVTVMKNIDDPVLALNDPSYGLDIRGYKLVPNNALLIKIAVYTPEIVEAILSDHSEIVDSWLSKLHEKYLTLKKSCEFDSNPVACFNIPPLEQFETHFQVWKEGGIITISIKGGEAIRIRNEKRREEKKTPAAALHVACVHQLFQIVKNTIDTAYARSKQRKTDRTSPTRQQKWNLAERKISLLIQSGG